MISQINYIFIKLFKQLIFLYLSIEFFYNLYMNLNHLYYFSVLAKTEHYTKAAELLNITQPTLSYSINLLEKELNCYLFEKQGRNVKLTKYGKILYEHTKVALKEIDTGKKEIETIISPSKGWINLGFIYALGYNFVPNILKEFKNNKIKFTLKQSNTTDILNNLIDEKLDVAICSYQERENVIFTPITTEELVVVTSKSHPLSHKKEIDLNELKDDYFIYYSKDSGIRPLIDNIFKENNINPNIIFEVEEDSAVLGLVDINYGVAIVPDIPLIDTFNLSKIKLKNKYQKRYIYLATIKGRYYPPTVTIFINFVTNKYEIKK